MPRSGVVVALAVGMGPVAAASPSGGTVGTPVIAVEPAGEWVSSYSVDVSWTVDHGGTLAGFAVVTDEQPDTDPGVQVTQSETYRVLYPGEGEHWVHVRALLSDGTASDVAHARIGVDRRPPVMAGLRSPTHPLDVVSTQREVTVEWDEPADTSGIAGYDVQLSRDEVPPTHVGWDGQGTETTEPMVQLSLPEDGEWYVHVRARDNAGLSSQSVSYPVVVDAEGPAASTVSGSHADGVETSQRRVVMSFSAAAQDRVEAWAAVVDGAPDTVPQEALARPEAQIAVRVESGVS